MNLILFFFQRQIKIVDDRDAAITKEAFERFLSNDETVLKLMVVYMAEYFGINCKGKSIKEVLELTRLRGEELEKELEEVNYRQTEGS